ncbi:MAG: hypothetical protein JHC73_04950 [Dolichospermum sp.]|nr:hypothetical protein [Dolichospermum sp.]
MKFNCKLKPTVISLFTLAFLQVQNPAIALVNQITLENFPSNLRLNTTQKITNKQPIQIARDDEYWGPQRDFKIWMPGEVVENHNDQLMTMNTTTKTVYMIFHKDIPLDIYSLGSQDIREVLQTALRQNIDMKGKVVKSTNMVIKGYPGIELVIQHSDGTQGQYQAYVVRRRMYMLGARTTDELTTEATNFFDSFNIYPTRIVRY